MILALRLAESVTSLPSREGDVEEEEAKDRVGKKGEGCFPPAAMPEDAETTAWGGRDAAKAVEWWEWWGWWLEGGRCAARATLGCGGGGGSGAG